MGKAKRTPHLGSHSLDEEMAATLAARQGVIHWRSASLRTTPSQRTQLNKLGGAEGVSTLFKLAQIDADGNGEISDEEVKKYLEDGQDAVNRMLELCLNSGIVSALILSFVTPALLTTVEQSDQSCGGFSHDGQPIAGHFSPSLCNAFSLAYLVMMQLTFFACSAAMFYSCRICKPRQSTPAAALRGRV